MEFGAKLEKAANARMKVYENMVIEKDDDMFYQNKMKKVHILSLYLTNKIRLYILIHLVTKIFIEHYKNSLKNIKNKLRIQIFNYNTYSVIIVDFFVCHSFYA